VRIALVISLIVLLAAAGCGSDDEPEASEETTAESAAGDTAGGEEPAPSGDATCADVDAPAPREDGGATAPEERLDPETTFTLAFETSCGTFTVTLDQASAPATSASLVALARDGFFDDTVFHRIVPGFVIQGGDPTQSGSGGPGYSTVDAPAQDAVYGRGVVAMAKTGVEPPGTAGSQFFVVTADAGLPPEYAIVGRVTDGLDVVDAIDAQGDAATELPLKPIVVESVTVAETG
jgi:peptidyl-prolyl cis-trans isomerase B (cyclophilin B)